MVASATTSDHPKRETEMTTRRTFIAMSAGMVGAALFSARADAAPFRLNYVLASAMYGTMPLDVVLGESAKAGAASVDVWCKPHGDQREQIKEMGDDAFAALLKKHGVKLGLTTQYALGPFALADELKFIKRMG